MDASDQHRHDLLAAFQASVVSIMMPTGTVPLAVGDLPVAGLPTPGGVVTAEHPAGEQADWLNVRATVGLHALLHRRMIAHVPTLSAAPDGTHREQGFYVTEISLAELALIGRAFGQLAVYWLDTDGLRVVACDQPMP